MESDVRCGENGTIPKATGEWTGYSVVQKLAVLSGIMVHIENVLASDTVGVQIRAVGV